MKIEFRIKPYDKDAGCYEAETIDGAATSRFHVEENSMTAAKIKAQFRKSFAQHFEIASSDVTFRADG